MVSSTTTAGVRLTVSQISKDFPTSQGILSILKDCTFSMSENTSLSLTGPSGSGKSTLLSIVGTLLSPTEGTVSLDGIELTELSPTERLKFRREQLGFILQAHPLLPYCSAEENVLIPFLADGKVSADAKARAEFLLERVGLKDRMKHRPSSMSGGECQRVAVARALVRRPSLILADEPTGNLDRKTSDDVFRLLTELPKQENALLIVVTHDLNLARQTDLSFRLENGMLVDSADALPD